MFEDRTGSRKLYDVEESRYVGLDELAAWIRTGNEVKVLDARTGQDLTAVTLTQIISEEERQGVSALGSEFLHQVVRLGGEALAQGVHRLERSVERVMTTSVDSVRPLRHARAELDALRASLEALEGSLATLEGRGPGVREDREELKTATRRG